MPSEEEKLDIRLKYMEESINELGKRMTLEMSELKVFIADRFGDLDKGVSLTRKQHSKPQQERGKDGIGTEDQPREIGNKSHCSGNPNQQDGRVQGKDDWNWRCGQCCSRNGRFCRVQRHFWQVRFSNHLVGYVVYLDLNFS